MEPSLNKIYLSKSNRANPDHVMMVRKHLLDKGYEIIEHKEGNYNPNLLLECSKMVMVGHNYPDFTKKPTSRSTLLVGKGQYGQLLHRRVRGLIQNSYFSGEWIDNRPVFRYVVIKGVNDEDNWTDKYGWVGLSMDSEARYTNIKRPRAIPVDESDVFEGQDMFEQADIIHKPHLACITLF